MKYLVALAFFAGLAAAQGPDDITIIETKTSALNISAGMNFGTINIDIFTPFSFCSIEDLGTEGNDFIIGAVDTFEDDELQGCANFTVPDKDISQLVLSHTGLDAWLPKYVRIYFGDGSSVECPDGEWIDNFQEHILECN